MKGFVIAALLISLAAVMYLFKPFLLDIAIAVLMAVATANLNALMAKKIPHASMRSVVLSGAFALLFLAPLVYAALAIASALKTVDLEAIKEIVDKIKLLQLPESMEFLRPKIEDWLAGSDLAALGKNALNYASNFSSKGLKFVVDLALIIVFYFFANYYGASLLRFLRSVVPLERAQWASLLKQLSGVMSVVFYSVLITAVFEGVLFAFIAWVFGYDAWLCGILYAFGSLIPVIGGALLWVPLAAISYTQGDTIAAVVIAVYSVVVISGVADTLLKPLIIKQINDKLLKERTSVNEMLIFFAMVAGIGTFGFWGIILGPAVLAFFLGMVQLFSEMLRTHG